MTDKTRKTTPDADASEAAANAWMRDPLAIQQLHTQLQQHIAVLHVAYEAGDGSLPRLAAYSGFLLNLQGELYWVTAAHCIEDVQTVQAHDEAKVHKVELLDPREPGKQPQPGIPFSEFFDCILPHPDDSVADVAVVKLPPHVRGLLEANPLVRVLGKEYLEGAEVVEGDVLCLVGVPCDLQESRCVEGRGSIELSGSGAIACLRVDVESANPTPDQDADFWSVPWALYRRVTLPAPSSGGPQSVKGMSGGPVFSLTTEDDGRVRYRLIGVQSSWIQESRVLRITPIRAVVMLIGLIEGWLPAQCNAPTKSGPPCRNPVGALGARCHHHE